jgi:hypothetical protein
MSATTGISPIGSYAGVTTAGAGIDRLVALLANPDTNSTSGAQAGGGFLDQMSPAAVVQLRVELAALRTVIAAFNAP